MQILPDSSSHGTGDPDVMLETRQSALDCLGYQPCHHRAGLNPKFALIEEFQVAGSVADHQAAKALVADQYIGAQSEHEILDTDLSGGADRPCQIVGRCCIVEEIGWTTDLECGVLSKRLIALEPLGVYTSR